MAKESDLEKVAKGLIYTNVFGKKLFRAITFKLNRIEYHVELTIKKL